MLHFLRWNEIKNYSVLQLQKKELHINRTQSPKKHIALNGSILRDKNTDTFSYFTP